MKPLRLTLTVSGVAMALLITGTALGVTASSSTRTQHAAGSATRDRAAARHPAPKSRPPTGRPATGTPTASQLLARTHSCDQVSDGMYAMREGGQKKIAICKTGSAYFWTSDMAIDCDGVRTDQCNPDTDSSFSEGTNFKTSQGEYFTADVTRYFVIPLPSYRFDYEEAGIKPGSVAAVIYKDKVVYAVFADLGPDDIIGEASYATAKALGVESDPSVGGTAGPVTFIVFPGTVPDPVEKNSVITKVGTEAARSFLRVSGPAPTGTPATPKPTGNRVNEVLDRPTPRTVAPGKRKAAQPKPKPQKAAPAEATPTRTAQHKPTSHKTTSARPSPRKTNQHKAAPKKPAPHKPAIRKTAPAPPSTAPATGPALAGWITGLDGKCVDVAGGRRADGTRAELDTCDGGGTQRWTIGDDSTLRTAGKCLTVRDRSRADGAPVEIRTCDGSTAQRWLRMDDRLASLESGKCLDVTGQRSTDGTPLQIWTCTYSANQAWSLPERPEP